MRFIHVHAYGCRPFFQILPILCRSVRGLFIWVYFCAWGTRPQGDPAGNIEDISRLARRKPVSPAGLGARPSIGRRQMAVARFSVRWRLLRVRVPFRSISRPLCARGSRAPISHRTNPGPHHVPPFERPTAPARSREWLSAQRYKYSQYHDQYPVGSGTCHYSVPARRLVPPRGTAAGPFPRA